MKRNIIEIFKNKYNNDPLRTYFSPGRVNIIGGHTDYNGGAVLPFCINFGLYAAISKRDDSKVRVYSENLASKGIIEFELNNLLYSEDRDFANYVSGVLLKLKENGYNIETGFNIVINGNLPRGGGLSSSAALSILICQVAKDLNNLDLSGKNMAIISRQVENHYIGVNCGIMDQFIIANGKKNHALYLESNTLYNEHIPCNMNEYKFVLVNSNTTRKLVESKYNVRQAECQKILNTLKEYTDIEYICDLSPEDYFIYEDKLKEDNLKRRFKHLVFEHDRVKKAKNALIKEDFVGLGRLLTEAHKSARDLFEISSDILDDLVEIAIDSGSLGSKMIGGGFGGSTLNLVKACELDDFLKNFGQKYIVKYQVEPIINIVEVTDGVSEI
jgi:galactokinase